MTPPRAAQPIIIDALFGALPTTGADWPTEQRVAWLRAAESIFRLVFVCEGRVAVEVAPPTSETLP